MSHVNEGDAQAPLEALQLELHLLAQLEVERAERLVEEQHGGAAGDGSRECYALHLAAGEGLDAPGFETSQLDHR